MNENSSGNFSIVSFETFSNKILLSFFWATYVIAFYDHGWNQSIVVQLIIPGNFLALYANLSLTGENNNIMWSLFAALLIK